MQRLSDEYGMPELDSEYRLPPEENPPREDPFYEEEPLPREAALSDDEFNLHIYDGSEAGDKRHKRVKEYFLKPVAAVLIGVTVIFSSYGIDPLGLDIFGESGEYFSEYVHHILEELGFRHDDYYDDPYDDPHSDPDPGNNSGSQEQAFENNYVTGSDAFPVLSNLEPDWNGQYSWSNQGPEYYVRVSVGNNEYSYLTRGTAFEGDTNYDAPAGISYDSVSNTLTLENCSGGVLDTNLMGNSFTINVVGDNSLDGIVIWGALYGGSVKITGSGTLTVNAVNRTGAGIYLNSEFSESCLMVDSGVTLDVYGDYAILATATSAAQAIYFLNPEVMHGGYGGAYTYPYYEYDSSAGKYLTSAESAELNQIAGTYGDYTVYNDDGSVSTHVRFNP